MSEDIVIKRVDATAHEVEALLLAERLSTNDSDYAIAEAIELLQRPEQHAYVAWNGQRPAGFVACFESCVGDVVQLEVDLLGVAPSHRCRGIGRGLVAHACAEGRRRGARRARAAVRTSNVASAQVFRAAGFVTSGGPRQMIVYPIEGFVPVAFLAAGSSWMVAEDGLHRMPTEATTLAACGPGHEVHVIARQGQTVCAAECLRVHTLAYRGIWIEGICSPGGDGLPEIGRAVVERAKSLGLDDVGMLAEAGPAGAAISRVLLGQGYQVAGEFDCYVTEL